MSNFDIEQCKRDGGLAIHELYGEVRIIVFEKDPDGFRVAIRSDCKTYYFVSDGYLTNIPKKKKITIYVYKNSLDNIFTSLSTVPSSSCELIDTIEKEYDI
jgi:hypothetical protein